MNRKVHAAQVIAVSALAFGAAVAVHFAARNDVLTVAVGFAIAANLMPTRKT